MPASPLLALAPLAPLLGLLAGALELQPVAGGGLALGEDGRTLARLSPRTPAAARGPAVLREVESAGQRVVEVAWPLRDRDARELWLGVRRAGERARIEPLWQGVAGAQDRDGETRFEVTLRPEGIFAHQVSATVTRCDGPAPLYPMRLDLDARRFVPGAPPAPAGASALAEPLPPGPDAVAARTAGRAFRWVAISDGPDARADARRLSTPDALDQPGTTWLGPVLAPGAPDGAPRPPHPLYATARAPAPLDVLGLRLWPVRVPAGRPFATPARLRVVLGRGTGAQFTLELPPPGEAPIWFPLPRPLRSACVTVDLEAFQVSGSGPRAPGPPRAALGRRSIVTAIDGQTAAATPEAASTVAGEILSGMACDRWLRLAEHAPPGQVDAALRAQLLRIDPRAVPDPALACVLRWFARADDAAPGTPADALPVAHLAAALGRLDDESYPEVRGAAERLLNAARPGAELVRALAPALGSDDPRARQRAARALAALEDASALAALLAALRDSTQRPAVRAALGHLPCAQLPRVLDGFDWAPPDEQADRLLLLQAALSAPATGPGGHARGHRCLDGAPALAASLLETARRARAHPGFAVRARAIALLAVLPLPAARDELQAALASATDPVLRFLAVEASDAVPVDLLRDRDPRVRASVARKLSAGLGGAEAGSAVLDALARERWPFVRSALLGALAATCPAGTHDWLDGKPTPGGSRAAPPLDADARRAVLELLVRCAHPRAPARLVGALARADEPPSVRERAAHLLAEIAPGEVPIDALDRVAARLVEETTRAPDRLDLEPIAFAALHALARHAPARALPRCLQLVAQARPTLRRGAIELLGVLCDPGAGHAALTEARASEDGWIASAAATALARCPAPERGP